MYKRRFVKRTFRPYVAAPKYATPSLIGLPNDCVNWLQSYSGQDVFVSSLKDQFIKNGSLTEKQWRMADKNYRNTLPKVQLPALNLNTPLPIVINRAAAFRETRDKLKIQYGIFALKVMSINNAGIAHNGNRWAELEVIADADSPVNACRICGKTLTDHASVLTGVGSVCAKKYFSSLYATYKKDPAKFIAPFKAEVAKLGVFKVRIWQNQVKENVSGLATAIDMFLNQTTTVPITPTPTVTAPQPIQPPAATIPKFLYINWNAKSDPWKLTDSGAYSWKVSTELFNYIINQVYMGANPVLKIFNLTTGNEVKFESPLMDPNGTLVSVIGYLNTGKSICLHIHHDPNKK